MPSERLSIGDHLVAYLAIAYLRLSARIPLPWVRAFTIGVGRLALRIVPRLWRVGMDNLDLAYGDSISREEKWRILRGAMDNIAIVAAEFSRLPMLNDGENTPSIEVEGDHFLTDGIGCLLISGHISNWEYMVNCVARLGYEMTVVVRPLNHPALNAVVDNLRRSAGVKTLPKDSAGPEVLRLLKTAATVGVLIDQSPRDNGVPVTFFGKPCWATIAPAMIALRAKVPVHFVSMRRKADGNYILRVHPPFELNRANDFKKDILENTQRCQDVLEAVVRENPEQWLWFHRRWKPRPRLEAEWNARLARNQINEAQK